MLARIVWLFMLSAAHFSALAQLRNPGILERTEALVTGTRSMVLDNYLDPTVGGRQPFRNPFSQANFTATNLDFMLEGDTAAMPYEPRYLSVRLDTSVWTLRRRGQAGFWVNKQNGAMLSVIPLYNTNVFDSSKVVRTKAQLRKEQSFRNQLFKQLEPQAPFNDEMAVRLMDSGYLQTAGQEMIWAEFDAHFPKRSSPRHNESLFKFGVLVHRPNDSIPQSFQVNLVCERAYRAAFKNWLPALAEKVRIVGRPLNFSDPYFLADSVVLFAHQPLSLFVQEGLSLAVNRNVALDAANPLLEQGVQPLAVQRIEPGHFAQWISATRFTEASTITTNETVCFKPTHTILFYQKGEVMARYQWSEQCRRMAKWLNAYPPMVFVPVRLPGQQWRRLAELTAATAFSAAR